MARLYAVSFGNQSKTGPQDLFAAYVGNVALRLRELRVSVINVSSLTQVTIDFAINRLSGTITQGSGGSEGSGGQGCGQRP